MIVIYHQNNKVIEIDNVPDINFQGKNIVEVLFESAAKFSDKFIIWCHIELKDHLNIERLPCIFHHKKIMVSYHPGQSTFLSDAIGYVEESVFLKINKNVSYPTWMMSSCVGGIHAAVLNTVINDFKNNKNFDYFLVSFSKLLSVKGLLCYSEPQLLKNKVASVFEFEEDFSYLFKFVKQHYKAQWTFFLFISLLLFERKFKIIPLLYGLFFRRRKVKHLTLDHLEVKSKKKVVESATIDVIIPTIGRKKYLYDVLKDLAAQTKLPKNIIIVEQNPDPKSISELDYLTSENWPFTIKHIFTHKTGACNARNLALAQVESEWTFLNDDDNRFDSNLLKSALKYASLFGVECFTTSYLQKDEVFKFKIIHQSGIFGSGNSFLKSEFLNKVTFDMALEYGYGEDTDFGLQLRNIGVDIIYFPELKITHLKAPMGGFRTKFVFPWEIAGEFPKPSPTIMYVKRKYLTPEQLSGYKLLLFLKMLGKQSFFKKIRFYSLFQEKWNASVKWSKQLW